MVNIVKYVDQTSGVGAGSGSGCCGGSCDCATDLTEIFPELTEIEAISGDTVLLAYENNQLYQLSPSLLTPAPPTVIPIDDSQIGGNVVDAAGSYFVQNGYVYAQINFRLNGADYSGKICNLPVPDNGGIAFLNALRFFSNYVSGTPVIVDVKCGSADTPGEVIVSLGPSAASDGSFAVSMFYKQAILIS